MAKKKPRLASRGNGDFTRYLFPILTTCFDHFTKRNIRNIRTKRNYLYSLVYKIGLYGLKKTQKTCTGPLGWWRPQVQVPAARASLFRRKLLTLRPNTTYPNRVGRVFLFHFLLFLLTRFWRATILPHQVTQSVSWGCRVSEQKTSGGGFLRSV